MMDPVAVDTLITGIREVEALSLSLQSDAESCAWWRLIRRYRIIKRWRNANREWRTKLTEARHYRLSHPGEDGAGGGWGDALDRQRKNAP